MKAYIMPQSFGFILNSCARMFSYRICRLMMCLCSRIWVLTHWSSPPRSMDFRCRTLYFTLNENICEYTRDRHIVDWPRCHHLPLVFTEMRSTLRRITSNSLKAKVRCSTSHQTKYLEADWIFVALIIFQIAVYLSFQLWHISRCSC